MQGDTLSDLSGAASSPALSEKLLRWVEAKGLRVPAVMLLELHRPLMPMAWSVAMLFGGVVAPLFGPDYYEKIEALRDPELIDRMLARLEASVSSNGHEGGPRELTAGPAETMPSGGSDGASSSGGTDEPAQDEAGRG